MIDMKNFLTSFGSAEEMFLSYAEGNFSAEEEQIFDQLLEDNPLLSRSFIDFGSSYSESSFDEISIPVEKEARGSVKSNILLCSLCTMDVNWMRGFRNCVLKVHFL